MIQSIRMSWLSDAACQADTRRTGHILRRPATYVQSCTSWFKRQTDSDVYSTWLSCGPACKTHHTRAQTPRLKSTGNPDRLGWTGHGRRCGKQAQKMTSRRMMLCDNSILGVRQHVNTGWCAEDPVGLGDLCMAKIHFAYLRSARTVNAQCHLRMFFSDPKPAHTCAFAPQASKPVWSSHSLLRKAI